MMPFSKESNHENAQIPQYVRLTSVFRNKLLKGEWKLGDQIPNITDLVQAYGVGRGTVRQALGLLAREGLITSTRGRGTFVDRIPGPTYRDLGLIEAINDPLEMDAYQTIKVLKRERVDSLPEALRGTAPLYDEYVRIKKLHYYRDKVFSLQDIYVAAKAYGKFPNKSDTKKKLYRIVVEAGFKIRNYRQEIIVTHPDHETALLLDYSMAGPIVQISRWRTDASGMTVTAGTYLYRADLFVLNIQEENPLVKPPVRSWVSTNAKMK
jgi:GntR family transcriptional regulator